MANILLNYVAVFRKAKPYSLYVLLILLLTYMLNQLDRYALSITSIEVAQEFKYGDKSCQKLSNQPGADICKNLNETL